MKKQNQVRRNGSPAAAAPQSKTSFQTASEPKRPEPIPFLVRLPGREIHQALLEVSRKSGAAPDLVAGAAVAKFFRNPVLWSTLGIHPPKGMMGHNVPNSKPKSQQSNAVDKTCQLAGFGGAPAELVPPSAGEVGVVIYDYDRDENVGEFNLTAAEFSRIRDAIAETVDRPVDREAVTNFFRESLVHPSALTSGEIQIAVQVLVDLAARKVQDCPIDEQICVWNALSKTLPDSAARELARNIALLQSKVAALHLQFADTLSSQAAQPYPQRRAA